ncbi:MAG: NADPH-dependent ferric siderophore reductase [Phenylobacterium sp.]|uniref:siderophore-interacting protein n=1 Tax=Phenylobacterium sp. TaxID=1871053 RepID=UPI0025E5CDC4|nr:siderophore-interacting protein [Phenylobacterium sp.]MBA4013903.1 NADPH-dependent ferric siderophore reductase [Phenylobacterium sp.]
MPQHASPPASPYRLFDVALKDKTPLSAHLWRFTFEGPEVGQMATLAPDQRIKIFFPDPQGRPPAMAITPDWYARYKKQDVETRPPMRTYTIRALRAAAGEVDVDFVLHGETGPASTWATRAQPGERLQLMAPNAAFEGDGGGYEWKPPRGLQRLLLIADETALPAVAGILEELAALPAPPETQLFIEVPDQDDEIPLATWPGLAAEWMARNLGAPGALMIAAAQRAVVPSAARAAPALAEVDVDEGILWDVSAAGDAGFYGWVAGEAAAVLAIRRLLITERKVDKASLNLMGYWREGRVLD